MVAPRVFLDFTVDGAPLGRVIFELYNVSAPKTSENFRALCTGEKGVSPLSQTPLYYKNSIIHRAIPDFMIQGGDFTKHNGTGGESIYGGPFADEDLSRPVDEPGLLVMANKGPNTNGSQFFITLRACPHLTGKHTVFGHVLRGFDDVVQRIAALPADAKDRPTVPVVISNCGELELRRPPPKPEPVERERGRRSVSVASDEESEKGRKRRKRRTPSHSRSRSRSWTRSRSRTPASREDDSTPEDTHRHGTKRSKHMRRDKKDKDMKEKKPKSKKPKHRSLSASRARSVEEGGDPAAAPLREETEEEYDARLEREERARIEAAHMRELAEVKRRYANDARRRSWGAGADDGGGVRYKGRGRMKYVDPEMRTRRHGD